LKRTMPEPVVRRKAGPVMCMRRMAYLLGVLGATTVVPLIVLIVVLAKVLSVSKRGRVGMDSTLDRILERLDRIDRRLSSIEDFSAHIEEVEISLSNQIKDLDKKLFRLESLTSTLVKEHGRFTTAALQSLSHIRDQVQRPAFVDSSRR